MTTREIIAKKIDNYLSAGHGLNHSIINSIADGLHIMNNKRFVNPNFPMISGEGLIGKAKLFAKRSIRKVGRPYVEPIVINQNLFNDATCETMQCVEGRIKEILDRNEQFECELQERRAELANLESQIGEFAIKKLELERFLEDINLRKKPFSEFDKRTTSQCGEDSIVMYVLHELGVDLAKVRYLDLGANHAISLSNTFSLYQQGARGVLVEANPALIGELKMYRSEDVVLNRCVSSDESGPMDFYVLSGDGLSTTDYEEALNATVINPDIKIEKTVSVDSICVKTIFETYFNETPEVVNVDIEGTEIEIINSIDFAKYRPTIFIMETIPYRTHLCYGEKRMDIVESMQQVGYVEYAFTGINSIFVDAKVLEVAE